MSHTRELFTKKFNTEVSGIEFTENSILIGGIEITYHHDQDCCERVYADFSVFKHYKETIDKLEVHKISIVGTSNMGFVVFFYDDEYSEFTDRVGVFVPCYNSQNGYYSDDLELVIEEGNAKTTIDLRGFVADDIC